jgi:RNA polymerase sigma-70 factor (ECF subfamily)
MEARSVSQLNKTCPAKIQSYERDIVTDDLTAIRSCLGGERAAFRVLVERYQTEALGHALAVLGNRDDAADAVQEAFCDAFVALAKFDSSREFYPWFYVILRNRCFKLLASRKRRPEAKASGSERLGLLVADSTANSSDVEEALWLLSAEDREIITLKHLDRLTYAELAERLEIPLGTVMSRLYHARRRLREQLEGVHHE